MADQGVPQGLGGPNRRSEPRTAAAPGEPRPGQPHATDGVPEAIENVAVDRQSRRYAHTLRRGEPSTPVRMPDAASSLEALDDQFEFQQTISRAKPTRPSEPPRAAEPPPTEPANPASPPSESTALYRKRSNPSMPALSPDIVARSAPPPAAPPEPIADAFAALIRDDDAVAADDGISRLPAVVLDAVGSGAVRSPLALRRSPLGLVIAIVLVGLIVLALWLW